MALLGKITLTIRDSKNKLGFLRFYISDNDYGNVGTVIEDVIGFWQEASQRLDPLITGVIEGISWSIEIPLPAGLKTVAENDSDIEEKARLAFSPLGTAVEGYACEIPSFDHAYFGTGTVIAFFDEADVDFFTQLLFNPTDAPLWAPEYGGISDNRVNVVTGLPKVFKIFRK